MSVSTFRVILADVFVTESTTISSGVIIGSVEREGGREEEREGKKEGKKETHFEGNWCVMY